MRNDVSQSQTMVGPLQVASDPSGPDTTVINAGMLATLQSDLVSYTGNKRDLTTTATPKTLQKTIFYGSSVSPAGDNCLCTVKTVDDAVLAQTVQVDALDAQVMVKTPITATDSNGNPYTAGQKLSFPWLEILNNRVGLGTHAGQHSVDVKSTYVGGSAGKYNTAADGTSYTQGKQLTTALGFNAGFENQGDQCLFLGPKTGVQNTTDYKVEIGGVGIGPLDGNGNPVNALTSTEPLIEGQMGSAATTSNLKFNTADLRLPWLPTTQPTNSDQVWNSNGALTIGAASSNLMVDRPTNAVTGQESLKASDNSTSVYSLKTLKAGQGLQITTPEDADCLQLGVSTDNDYSVILSNGTPSLPQYDVMIGYDAGRWHDSFNQGKNVCIGRFAGKGGYGRNNVFIGYDAGRYITGHSNTYIGCTGPNTTSESSMLRIGTKDRELITGKAYWVDPYIRFNTGHVEVDVANLPGLYSGTYPDRIWSDNGTLNVGSPKSFFVSVSGATTQGAFNNTWQTYVFPTVDSDTISSYDSSTGQVTLPYAGLYSITGSIEVTGNQQSAAGRPFGVGVHTSNSDGSHVLWHTAAWPTSGTDNVKTSVPYARLARFDWGVREQNAQLRMIIYVDHTSTLTMAMATMSIYKVAD